MSATPGPDQRTVAISYSWKEEIDGKNAGKVDALCARLREHGVKVLRDKDSTRFGDDLVEFMKKVSKSDRLCVLLSDFYLRSASCMRELLSAWTHNDDGDGLNGRVKVWVMESAEIFHADGRAKYAAYWKEQRTKLEATAQTIRAATGQPGEHEPLVLLGDILNRIDRILGRLAKTLSPSSYEEFEQWVCSEFALGCGAHPETVASLTSPEPAPSSPTQHSSLELEQRLREVFPSQYEHLAELLKTNEPLRNLLVRKFSCQGISGTALANELIYRFHLRFLDALGQFTQLYSIERVQRDIVSQLVGAMIYLALAPESAAELSRGEDVPAQLKVSVNARQGIVEMLLCWIRTRGRHPVPLTALSQEKRSTMFESTPQMQFDELLWIVMDRLGIPKENPRAQERVKAELISRRRAAEPMTHALAAGEEDLIARIQAPGSPLKDLLLVVMHPTATIRPSEPDFDIQLEAGISLLLKKLAEP